MSKKTKKDENSKPVNTGQTAADKEIEEEKEISENEQPEKQEQVNISKEAEEEDEEPESETAEESGASDETKTEKKSGSASDTPKARKKGFIRKHGKTLLTLAVLFVIALMISRIYSVQKAAKEIASAPEPEFREVERRDISNSIAVTATVQADDKRTVSTLVSNTKVLDVYYEVGDYVQEGDVICIFDTSNVSENIARLQKKMNVTTAKNQVNVKDAHIEVDKAGTTWAYDGQDNEASIARTQDSYNRAVVEYDVACSDYSDAVKTKDEKRDEYHDVKGDYEEWKSKYDDLPEDVKTGTVSGNEEQMATKSKYKYYSELYSSAESAYNTAKKAVETAEADVRSKSATVESARQKVEDADKKYPRDLLSDGVTVRTKQDSEYVASLDASIANQDNEKTMSEYEQELEDSVVRAPISGMITALNVHRGDEFAEKTKTDVCVIQDDSGYTVKGNVDQYNISSVTEGMSALIKTEATGDEMLQGTVKFVSPVSSKETTVAAQSGTSSSSDSKSDDPTKVSYPVEITLMKRDPRLRLGMTAETSLIVSKRDQVLVVPYDCIAEDEFGYKCVYVETEDPESESEKEEKTSLFSSIKNLFVMPEAKDEVKTKKVIVQTGLETDYYIEVISDEIKEGDKVKVPDVNDSDGSADVAAMEVVPETDDASGNEEAEDTSEGVSAGAGGF